MAEGKQRKFVFGVSDDGILGLGLTCGGEIEILVEPII
jgi:xanthine/CO dehydrogenase XdhC/CoxF family maturation factor